MDIKVKELEEEADKKVADSIRNQEELKNGINGKIQELQESFIEIK